MDTRIVKGKSTIYLIKNSYNKSPDNKDTSFTWYLNYTNKGRYRSDDSKYDVYYRTVTRTYVDSYEVICNVADTILNVTIAGVRYTAEEYAAMKGIK